jgi:hypothetical protein
MLWTLRTQHQPLLTTLLVMVMIVMPHAMMAIMQLVEPDRSTICSINAACDL